jgi:hypothetical protein
MMLSKAKQSKEAIELARKLHFPLSFISCVLIQRLLSSLIPIMSDNDSSSSPKKMKRKAEEKASDQEEPNNINNSSDSSAEEEENSRNVKSSKKAKSSGIMKKNADNELYLELGRKRRVTVRKYQKSVLIDIREYYEDKNDQIKPGNKGIALSVEQFETLCKSIQEVNQAVLALSSGR